MKRLMLCSLLFACTAAQEDTQETPKEKAPAATEVVKSTGTSTGKVDSPAEAEGGLGKMLAKKLSTPTERRLYPSKFSASSHLENDWNKFQENYLATYLGDDNPKTSWTEGKSDVGLGETVTVEHTHLQDVDKLRIEIRNGYQKSESLFARNARAKEITLKLLPSGSTSKHTLKDAQGWQSVSVDQETGPLHGYEIRFDSVYKGTHYEDLVVSDIQTFVSSLTPDNPSYELSQQKRLLDWVNARKEAAATFKTAAKGSIPVAPRYKSSERKGTAEVGESAEDFDGSFPLPFKKASKTWGAASSDYAFLKSAVAENFGGWKHVRISPSDQRKIPQSDAFNFPGSWSRSEMWAVGDDAAITMPTTRQLSYFSANSLKRVYVETSAVSAASVIMKKAPGCKSNRGDQNFFFTPKSDGPLQYLLIATCGRYEERDGYSTGSYWQILSYAKDGQLEKLFDHYSAYDFQWVKKSGAPFLEKVARVSTAGANDTNYVAR